MSLRSLFLALPFLAACGTVHEWRELQTAPMPIGECFDGIAFIAKGAGLASDDSVTDRGNGIWQSRWRQRALFQGRPGRYRLRAEVLIDEGSPTKVWPLRFAVEAQKVKDERRYNDARDEDFSSDGQDREKEAILGEALQRRLAPKPLPGSQPPRRP